MVRRNINVAMRYHDFVITGLLGELPGKPPLALENALSSAERRFYAGRRF
jgi:hypothetical protein